MCHRVKVLLLLIDRGAPLLSSFTDVVYVVSVLQPPDGCWGGVQSRGVRVPRFYDPLIQWNLFSINYYVFQLDSLKHVCEKSCSFTIFLVPWSNEPYIHWINTLFYTVQNYIWWNVCCHARLSAEVVARVQQGSHLRPDTTGLDVAESVARCLHSCWDEDPENRPDFRFVRVKLKEMQAGL